MSYDQDYAQTYYQANREKIRESQRIYRAANKDKINAKNAGYPYTARMVSKAKTRAKQKGIPFNITIEDVTIPDVCPYLGIPLFVGVGPFEDNSPSLDRITPELGYVKGNVRVISNAANMMKRNYKAETLLAMADGIYRLHS